MVSLSIFNTILNIKNSKTIEQVHKETNSMKDALIRGALIEGHRDGVRDEKEAEKERDKNA